MTKYKIMFREKKGKKYYNFRPTVSSSAKPRYSNIDSTAKANAVKREMEKRQKDRVWKIKRK